MLSALMSCRGYFELGIGDVSSEYKVSVKQFQISGGGGSDLCTNIEVIFSWLIIW